MGSQGYMNWIQLGILTRTLLGLLDFMSNTCWEGLRVSGPLLVVEEEKHSKARQKYYRNNFGIFLGGLWYLKLWPPGTKNGQNF